AGSKLESIFRGAENFPMVDVYVHGSWADNSRTAFSDLDDLVIIDRSKLRGQKAATKRLISWLNKVELRLYRMDLLQHHGHWIIFKDMLRNYDQSYIPLNVLNGAIIIQGQAKIH